MKKVYDNIVWLVLLICSFSLTSTNIYVLSVARTIIVIRALFFISHGIKSFISIKHSNKESKKMLIMLSIAQIFVGLLMMILVLSIYYINQ